jgi:hypothetical protein
MPVMESKKVKTIMMIWELANQPNNAELAA